MPRPSGARISLDDLPALRHPRATGADRVRGPDAAIRVQRAAVRRELQLRQRLGERAELGGRGHLRPDPAFADRPVGGEREGGVAGARGLADDQRPAVGGDHRPVREQQVVGEDAHGAVRVHPHQLRGRRVGESLQVEAELADVGAAGRVDDHVVEVARRSARTGRRGRRPRRRAGGGGSGSPSSTRRAASRRASSPAPRAGPATVICSLVRPSGATVITTPR